MECESMAICVKVYHGAGYSSNLAGPMILTGKLQWRFHSAAGFKGMNK